MSHEEKIALARAFACHKAVYFQDAILSFVYVARHDVETMLLTEGLVCAYGIAWAERATIENLAADIAHEVHHFVRKHFLRFRVFDDRFLANLAADLAINTDIVEEGWALDKNSAFPERYGLPKHLSMEEYYELLLKKQKKQKEETSPSQFIQALCAAGEQKAQKGGTGEQRGQSEGNAPNSGGQKEEGDGEGKSDPQVSRGACGGIVGHSHNPQLEAELDAEHGRSELEKKLVEAAVKERVRAYAVQGRGKISGELVEWAKKEEEPPVLDWRSELDGLLRYCTGAIQSGGSDFSMRRPSNRSYTRGILRPGLIEYQPEVAIVLDTSGSMGEEQLMDAVRESVGILRALEIEQIWFAEADADVSMEFERVDLRFFLEEFAIKGRGGTDFRPALAAAQKLDPLPDLIIYMTDGDGAAPDVAPPDMEVVWGIVTSYRNAPPCDWGHTILIPRE